MGRKIPAKKHRGIKDPLVQQAKRLKVLKGKINAPPKDPDEQPVPRSLTQLFSFQDRSKVTKRELKNNKKRHIKGRDGCSQNENPVAKLQKLPGESGRGFSLRINNAIKTIHNPLQDGYPLDIDTEDVKGEQMALQRARRKKKLKKMAGASEGGEAAPALGRVQRLALKRKAKREEAEQRAGEPRYERVPFGEVAHAPPALPAPRATRTPRQPRQPPGRRELLLKTMLSGAGTGVAGGLGGHKQQLPAVEVERRERARLAAVAAYRALRRSATHVADAALRPSPTPRQARHNQ